MIWQQDAITKRDYEMIRENLEIGNIPAILWGGKSDKIFIAVHGNMSNKADDVITIFAQEATAANYQVISFDLPEHGDRKKESTPCKVQNCIQELNLIMEYAKSLSGDIRIFACSMGAYFSLLTYRNEPLQQSIFLSPVVDMERMIGSMMAGLNISDGRLKAEKVIETPIGVTLYWDYYRYVKSHPVNAWSVPTSILYGSEDNVCDYNTVSSFSKQFNCNLKIMEGGEHYFHTNEQLLFFREWVRKWL